MNTADFTSRIDVILESVDAASIAFNAGHVPVSVRDHVAEYGVIESAGLFELFVGELFVDCLLDRTVVAKSLVPLASEREAELVLFRSDQPEPFLSWLPYEVTEARAKRLLVDAEPFGRLRRRAADISVLKDLSIVRNFAAHGSDSSKRKFDDLCARRSYAGVTRASDYVLKREQGSTQLELMLTRLKLMVAALTDPDEDNVLALLGSEDPWRTAAVAPRGRYRCETCSSEQTLPDPGQLVGCPTCRPTVCSSCGKRHGTEARWLRLSVA